MFYNATLYIHRPIGLFSSFQYGNDEIHMGDGRSQQVCEAYEAHCLILVLCSDRVEGMGYLRGAGPQ